MRKIVLAAALCSTFAMANIEDYKKGFEAAIESMRLQLNLNNVKPERIDFKEDNVLFVDIKNLDSTSVLLMQHLANTNSFNEVFLAKNRLYIGSYEREADSIKYKIKAESILGERVVIQKKSEILNEFTNPLFFKEFYSSLVRKDNTILIKEPIYIKEVEPKKVKKVPVKKVSVPKTFTLTNGMAQSYTLEENVTTSQAKNFKESDIKKSVAAFIYGKSITTGDGKVFIKVDNANMYFLKDDVRY